MDLEFDETEVYVGCSRGREHSGSTSTQELLYIEIYLRTVHPYVFMREVQSWMPNSKWGGSVACLRGNWVTTLPLCQES